MSRLLLAGALGCTLALGTLPVRATAATSDELQAQLDEAEARLEELNRAAQQAGAELDKASYDLDQTRTQIAQVEDDIEVKGAELADAQDNLAGLLSDQYKVGTYSLLDIVLNAEDFDDLVSRVTYANKISENRQEAIAQVRDLQTQLQQSRDELGQKEAQQEQQVADLQEKMSVSEEAESEAATYVSQLSDDVKEALAAEQAAREEASRKEAERLAAEEAARQEQEAANNAGQGNDGAGDSDQGGSSNGGSDDNGSSNEGTSDNGGSNGSGSEGSNQGSATPPNNGGSTAGETAVYWAKTQLGKPYGHDNNGNNWDCNGLTHWAWAQAGYSIPAASGHYGYGQFQYMKNSGRWVTSVSQLKPGDLVFYSYDGGYTTYHVAMYIGGYQVIHSNGWGSGVVITGIYYDDGFCGGGTP